MSIREQFEKQRCKQQCSDHCKYDGLCKEYDEYLEQQIKAKDKVIDTAISVVNSLKESELALHYAYIDEKLTNLIKAVDELNKE